MNYTRRSTRPDAAYYRETRKIRHGGGGGRRADGGGGAGKGLSLIGALALFVALAVLVWFIFLRH